MVETFTMNRAYSNRKTLRRMKYLSDQKGIMNRYLAEGENWEPHLKKTKDFILKCLQENKYDSVAVIGSGWLLDIPMDFLAENYKSVYLLDAYHPPQILQKIRKLENVRAIVADVTGGAILGAYQFARAHRKSGRGSILDIPVNAAVPGMKTDYMISLNILNQLDILLIDYLKKHVEIPPEEEIEFRKRIQSQHLSLLKPGKSCLVTDAE